MARDASAWRRHSARKPRTGSRRTSATLARRARTAGEPRVRDRRAVALKATIRAAFYYPWFPQTWGRDPQNPFTNYAPTRGRYSTDLPTVKAQIADMQYAGVSVGLASWFGQGSNTNANWPVLFRAARGTGFRWAPYYEPEGTSDPTPRVIAADLHYLRRTYGGGSALAMLPGKRMLVFVYNADDLDTAHGCATVTRWKQAKHLLRQQYAETIYVDLKVFRGYATCADDASVDGWHQYGPASAVQDFSHAPRRRLVRNLPGVLEGRHRLRHRTVPGPRPGALAVQHRGDERLRGEVAADHHLQRVGRGHRDRELLRLPRQPAAGYVLRLERGRHHLRTDHRPAQRTTRLTERTP